MEAKVLENNYKPTAKAQEFHGSDCFFQVLVGGMGSGKSKMVIHEIETTAMEHPECPIAIYRKTLPSLRDSTLEEWRTTCTPELWEFKERDIKAMCINESFVNFRGLDDPNKVKSTEYALIVMEEADEFTLDDFKFLKARVRKKGPWKLRIVLLLNPVDEEHWIYQEFVKNAKTYQDNGGLLVLHMSTYDNIDNLPANYISTITAGMSPDEIDRYVHGHWGTIVKGEPVYKKYLNPDIHLEQWEYKHGIYRLVRGWDFGFNRPACSFRLIDPSGRKNCNHAMLGDKIDLDVFAKQVLEVTERKYPGVFAKDFGDPRGHDKTGASSSENASTSFQILSECGIHATGERGVRAYVEPGIKQVRKEFSTLINGKPELTIDPRNTLIRTAYFGKYVRDEDGIPKKDGYYDHIADADRYISHHSKQDDSTADAIKANKAKRDRERARAGTTGYQR